MIRLIAAFILILPSISLAGPIKGKTPSGYNVLSISGNTADTSANSSSSFTVNPASSNSRLALIKTGTLAAQVVAAVKYKNSYYSVIAAQAAGICKKSSAKLIMGLKSTSKTLNVGKVKLNTSSGVAYLENVPSVSNLDSRSKTTIGNTKKCYPAATGKTLGLTNSSASSRVRLAAVAGDTDGDGMPNQIDIDEDGDGILNSYDQDTTNSNLGSGITSARVFSNLKLSIENSLNLYTSTNFTISQSEIDTAANQIGLAMQVAGGTSNATELNCGSLTYCSSGGTGFYDGAAFPDGYDADNDGMGTMSIGATGDFQLMPLVTSSSSIKGGDTYIEVVTDNSNNSTKIPTMLNFVFRTTPAIKSLTMGGVTTSITYPASSGMLGTPNNPINAPIGWNGQITIVAYRPQRPGIAAAGEGSFVDVGNSKIVIDIPNAPCSGSGGCTGSGPGNCVVSSYSTTDTNLSVSGDTLLDSRGDKSSDTSNPDNSLITFTLDLDACLAHNSLTLNSGEKTALDLQFRSDNGDNSAQKFYIARL